MPGKQATSPTSIDPDWQTRLPSQKERNKFLINNDTMADVHFVVGEKGEKKVAAHKFPLCSGSPVFYSMFYGGLADGKDEVAVPDIEEDIFLNLLRYLYCEETNLTADNVMGTLYAAKKYIIPPLTQECIQFLYTNLDVSNVLVVLKESITFDEAQLTRKCWNIIDTDTKDILESDGFPHIELDTLKDLLSRNTLSAPETDIFDACSLWAAAECGRQNLEMNAVNKRRVLGEALYLIRFPLMSPEEFANGPLKSGIVPERDVIDIFSFHHAKDSPKISFSSTPRNTSLRKSSICHRFTRVREGAHWRYTPGKKADFIVFSVDHSIKLEGIGLYGINEVGTLLQGRLNVALINENTKFYEKGCEEVFQFKCDKTNENIHSVMFEKPVEILNTDQCVIRVCLDTAKRTSSGLGGQDSVTYAGVTFTFYDVVSTTGYIGNVDNGTSVRAGQIPQLIFHKIDVV